MQQLEQERGHLVWAGRDAYMYDADDYLVPSAQMAALGVTSDMLRAYGRWLPIEVIDTAGIYTALPGCEAGDVLISDMFARIPALAARPVHSLALVSGPVPTCSFCGHQPGDTRSAIADQIGEDLCRELGRGLSPKDLPALIENLGRHGKRVRPNEWTWLHLIKASRRR